MLTFFDDLRVQQTIVSAFLKNVSAGIIANNSGKQDYIINSLMLDNNAHQSAIVLLNIDMA